MALEWRGVLTRIQIEYIEMPDVRLTVAQIRRLCNLSQGECDPAIAALLQTGFLRQTPDGRFVRRVLGQVMRPDRVPIIDPVPASLTLVNQVGD